MTADADGSKLVIRRRIAATREELFEQWTDLESMRVWMCPDDIVSTDVLMDLRVGGSLLITMRSPTHAHEHRGEFTIIDRPAKLAFTWIAEATDSRPTLVTVEFFEVSEAESDLVLTHDKLPGTEVRDRHRGGWNQIVGRLEQFLQSKR
jgi:uncharacterized protein YndB with AHSA1/START domain